MKYLKNNQIIYIKNNMHILLTRPLEDCHELILKFQLLGHEVSHMPLISIKVLKHEILNYSDFFVSIVSFISTTLPNEGGW